MLISIPCEMMIYFCFYRTGILMSLWVGALIRESFELTTMLTSPKELRQKLLGELKENNLFKSPEERKDANGNVKSDLTFELEANNFFDKSGNIQKGSYMEDGWVDESAGPEGPGFFENLFGKK